MTNLEKCVHYEASPEDFRSGRVDALHVSQINQT